MWLSNCSVRPEKPQEPQIFPGSSQEYSAIASWRALHDVREDQLLKGASIRATNQLHAFAATPVHGRNQGRSHAKPHRLLALQESGQRAHAGCDTLRVAYQQGSRAAV